MNKVIRTILILFLFLTPILTSAQTSEEFYKEAISKLKEGNKSGGIADLDKAIETDPTNVGALFMRGNVKNDNHEYKEAMKDYNKVIELKPDYAMVYSARGVCRYNLGYIYDACLDFKKAHEMGEPGSETLVKKVCK